MTWNEYPEVKLAQRVLKKHLLSPPIKIRSLLESYSTVFFDSIPIAGVDGVAVNIKVPGKTPIIIIDQDTTETRQRFTMAHELGHLLIPWHTGIRIDDSGNDMSSEFSYQKLEVEANRFAAELLMPSAYIRDIASQSIDLARAQKEICNRLKVSPHAAATHIINTFPAGVVYSAVKSEIVIHARKTKGTSVKAPLRQQMFDEELYQSAIKKSFCKFNDTTFYWWEMVPNLSGDMNQIASDWRPVLDEIVSFIESQQDREKYKRSINGIIAHVNSRQRREVDYSIDSLLAGCYKRFDKDEHSQLRNHRSFDVFLRLRLTEFLERAKGYNPT